MSPPASRVPAPARIDIPATAIALALLAAALVIAWDAFGLSLGSTYGVGPKAMPLVVAAGLGVLALANLALALRGTTPSREPMDARAVVLILSGMAALIATIGLGGGFILATALLFACTATAFGRRRVATDLGIGLALGFVIYLAFDKLLTLSLPSGPLERLL